MSWSYCINRLYFGIGSSHSRGATPSKRRILQSDEAFGTVEEATRSDFRIWTRRDIC